MRLGLQRVASCNVLCSKLPKRTLTSPGIPRIGMPIKGMKSAQKSQQRLKSKSKPKNKSGSQINQSVTKTHSKLKTISKLGKPEEVTACKSSKATRTSSKNQFKAWPKHVYLNDCLRTLNNKTTQMTQTVQSKPTRTVKKVTQNTKNKPIYRHRLGRQAQNHQSSLNRRLFQTSALHELLPNPNKKHTLNESYENQKDWSLIHTAVCTPKQPDVDIFQHQKQVNHRMRSILVDWMIQISSELSLSRETVHSAIDYLDTYVSKINVVKSDFQLCGIVCLILAVKQQGADNKACVNELLGACGQGQYSSNQVFKTQTQILMSLKFRLKVYTYGFWIDYLTSRWEVFSKSCLQKSNLFRLRQLQVMTHEIQTDLKLLIDTSIYIRESTSINKARRVLGAMYLVFRVYMEAAIEKTSKSDMFVTIYKGFQDKPTPIFTDKYNFNLLFNEFLIQLCDFEMQEVIPQIKYMSQYMDMPFSTNTECQEPTRHQTYSPQTISYVLQKK